MKKKWYRFWAKLIGFLNLTLVYDEEIYHKILRKVDELYDKSR